MPQRDKGQPPPPRIYCIAATRAPVVAVLMRGPAKWAHVGRWNLDAGTYESGAWLRATIYPRRCDLSPDGKLLSYFTLNPAADWEYGNTYVAISKLPWLTALQAIGTCGTWTGGYYFTEDRNRDVKLNRNPHGAYGLHPYGRTQFAVERQRGWVEAPDSPPRRAGDLFDEERDARVMKQQPGGERILRQERLGRTQGGEPAVEGIRVGYSLESDGEVTLLEDIQWADWDTKGNLLVATRSGHLQSRYLNGDLVKILFEYDLAQLKPKNTRPPDKTRRW